MIEAFGVSHVGMVRSINEDSFVQSLKDNFNAEVVPGSVKPVT